jgi:hypothetical protein
MNGNNVPSNDLSLRSPALTAFVDYLGASGWVMSDEDARTSLWRRDVDDDKSLVLPKNQNVTDYRDLAYEALRLLAYVESRSLQEITSDIIYGPADNIAVRLTPDMPSGQAPLSLAYEAVSALRSYVIGSGAALDDHSLVLPARRSRQAESYASAARLSTAPGSFILSLSLPLTADLQLPEYEIRPVAEPGETPSKGDVQEELVSVPPQPFGRRVTSRMAAVARYAQGLAVQVSDGNERLVSFGKFATNAPNATELEALGGLGGPDRSPYEVRFSQTPLASERIAPFALRVTPGQQAVMVEAAEYLRTRQSRPNVTAEGLVVGLSRTGNFGPGEVTLLGIIDDSGKRRRFHVELTEEDYSEAFRAHGRGLHVVVRGDLTTRGNRKWLRNAKGFAIVPGIGYDDDDEE